MTPSQPLLQHLAAELRRHEPFGRVRPSTLHTLVAGARESYFSPGETVLDPAGGVVEALWLIRRGAVLGESSADSRFRLDAGELFPLGAVVGTRAVSSVYRAEGDLFCLAFEAREVRRLIDEDPVLADFANRRIASWLAMSNAALQVTAARRVLSEQSFDAVLGSLVRRAPVGVAPQASVAEALELMQRTRVGSVLVLDDAGAALGILTRHDLLALLLRVPAPDWRATPIESVMSRPVHTLDVHAHVHDAALLMSRHALRHVPITEAGRVVSMVSERDLFALQRLSLNTLSAALREATDLDALQALAPRIREFAHHLLAQGLGAPTLTALVSHLNDLLTQRGVALMAGSHGLDLERACWLAFGSEGRSEQTIATDQDNGLVLADDAGDAEVQRWLEMARQTNAWLDACGYPLCRGGIMAGNPECCLRRQGWLDRFDRWIGHGEPQDLLAASIFFDLRALAGDESLARALQERIDTRAASARRFLRRMAENSLQFHPALNWHGGLATQAQDGREWLDLKLHGTAPFVDAARLMALALGRAAITGTRERLLACGAAMGVAAAERESWAGAFEMLQMLRLRAQVEPALGARPEQPNHIDVRALSEIDRRLLVEALRVGRRLQQRVQLDWLRGA